MLYIGKLDELQEALSRTESEKTIKDGELQKALRHCEETNERTRILMNMTRRSKEWMEGIRTSVDEHSINLNESNKLGKNIFQKLYDSMEQQKAELRKLEVCFKKYLLSCY